MRESFAFFREDVSGRDLSAYSPFELHCVVKNGIEDFRRKVAPFLLCHVGSQQLILPREINNLNEVKNELGYRFSALVGSFYSDLADSMARRQPLLEMINSSWSSVSKVMYYCSSQIDEGLPFEQETFSKRFEYVKEIVRLEGFRHDDYRCFKEMAILLEEMIKNYLEIVELLAQQALELVGSDAEHLTIFYKESSY